MMDTELLMTPVLPEAFVATMACAILVIDLLVKSVDIARSMVLPYFNASRIHELGCKPLGRR